MVRRLSCWRRAGGFYYIAEIIDEIAKKNNDKNEYPKRIPVNSLSILYDFLHSKYWVPPSNISGIINKAISHFGYQKNHKTIENKYPKMIPVHLAQIGN